jgi:hypothetical protein
VYPTKLELNDIIAYLFTKTLSKSKLFLQAVCAKVGIDIKDRLDKDSKKRKFLVSKPPNFAVRNMACN